MVIYLKYQKQSLTKTQMAKNSHRKDVHNDCCNGKNKLSCTDGLRGD